MAINPKVSIGLPVYNGGEFLEEALRSLASQTLEDFELIISDNGSTDQTETICRRWADDDARIRYLRNEVNQGAAWNFNNAFLHAKGEYFTWAAHDDLREPRFLEVCSTILDENPEVVLAYTGIAQIDESGNRLEPWQEYRDLTADDPRLRLHNALRDWMCLPVFGLIRTEALRKTGLIRPFHASDRLLLAELALQGKFTHWKEQLFVHRQHPGMSGIAFHGPYRRGHWWDPNSRTASHWPHWLYYINVAKVIATARLSLLSKLLALADVLRLMAGQWKQLLFDLVRPLRNRLSRKPAY